MKIITYLCITLCFLNVKSVCLAEGLLDPRLSPVRDIELRKKIQSIPLSSPQHYIFISQAVNSRLQKEAHDNYFQVLSKNKDDYMANILYGLTCDLYRQSLIDMSYRKKLTQEQTKLIGVLSDKTQDSYRRAIRLQPSRGEAYTELGYYTFYQLADRRAGTQLMRKGSELSPKSSRAHRLLGFILSSPLAEPQNNEEAEKEFRTAIALDNLYAAPHINLARLYLHQKKIAQAQQALDQYLKRVPPSVRKSTAGLQKAIDEQMKKSQ